MPALTPKWINGSLYYYLRRCQRVDGKPKIVETIYLGSAEQIASSCRLAKSLSRPKSVRAVSFGDVAALFDQASALGLADFIDAQLPKRHQGLSVGQYLVLAAINRAACPTSKAQLAHWYQGTALTHLLPASQEQLSSQTFWNHMERIKEADITAIEDQISTHLVKHLGLDLRTLVYDGTNFFTYINTCNPATLPARGHNKQKRGDLRQVSLGMLVSTDFHVPLLHKLYTGNVPDTTAFQTISQQLCQRYEALSQGCEHITLIFDKGNNSPQAFETLGKSGFHFIGSLVASDHADLLEVPLEKFHLLKDPHLEDCQAWRTRKELYGQMRTVLVTYNPQLLEGQLQGISANLQKASRKLEVLQTQLKRRQAGEIKGGRAPTVASLDKKVAGLLSAQHLKVLLRVQVSPPKGNCKVPELTFQIDEAALAQLSSTQLGKTILFTDNEDWSDEEIVLGYRAQHHIESAFRDMKNPHFLSWSPLFHWTDSKIRVHGFYVGVQTNLHNFARAKLHNFLICSIDKHVWR